MKVVSDICKFYNLYKNHNQAVQKFEKIVSLDFFTKYEQFPRWNKFLRTYQTNHLNLVLNYTVCVANCCKH